MFTAKNHVGVETGDNVVVSVRPHSITIEPEYCPNDNPGMNCFTAWVERHDYFGDFREYTVRLENSDIILSVVTSPDIRHAVGARLYLAISAECCRVVPRNPKIATQVTESVLAMT